MTFVEWYEDVKGEAWDEAYRENEKFIGEMEDEYYEYCHENDIEPIWNG